MKYIVKEKDTLLEFLLKVTSKKKKDIKSLLKYECILVNNKIITRFDYQLEIDDVVSIKNKRNDLDILFEDEDLIIINKPPGLLTISTEKEKNNTLYRKVSDYVKEKNKSNKIFIVNRIDKDTSGIVVFSKNKEMKEYLQNNWNNIIKKRIYIAIVQGITKDKDTIESYLKEDENYNVYSSNTGKKAITKYTRIKYNKNYSMLKLELLTGRKNQIRVHMKDINHPIVGDCKYGNKGSRLMLHAYELEFIYKNKSLNIVCDYDEIFDKMI